jgi:hypothetical protein
MSPKIILKNESGIYDFSGREVFLNFFRLNFL